MTAGFEVRPVGWIKLDGTPVLDVKPTIGADDR